MWESDGKTIGGKTGAQEVYPNISEHARWSEYLNDSRLVGGSHRKNQENRSGFYKKVTLRARRKWCCCLCSDNFHHPGSSGHLLCHHWELRTVGTSVLSSQWWQRTENWELRSPQHLWTWSLLSALTVFLSWSLDFCGSVHIHLESLHMLG